ncbi:MAG: hypothetical protein HY717_05760 [Planctomycetes bacterium]|nr:hypothetical protein [Planctomycetota bacterium]
MKHPGVIISLCFAILALPLPGSAQNLVVNPGFQGSGGFCVGVVGGTVNCPGGTPDDWRLFAVGDDSSIELEIVPLAAGEIHPGSPETNGVLVRLNGSGIDQGFDSFFKGVIPIKEGLDYHAEFYVKSANTDDSDQTLDFNFIQYDQALSLDTVKDFGSVPGAKATSVWKLITGPTFRPEPPLVQGFIGWRVKQDGGEDAILVALPSVTTMGVQVLPTNLTCVKDGRDVRLAWTNHAVAESLKVLRDGIEIASLAVDATAYVDTAVSLGDHTYQILATAGPQSGGPNCTVTIFNPPAPGESVSVDVGAIDVENGLQNSVRETFYDGESEAVTCGPEGDRRDARLNYASDGPNPDPPDNNYYFTVTDPAMKEQRTFRLDLEVYDDPRFAGLILYLQWTHRNSTGPADFSNTFFPPTGAPKVELTGSGKWVTATWFIEDAGFRTFMLARADFRVGVTGNARLCLDRAKLTFFPAPVDLRCKARAGDVTLSWTNAAAYDGIRILRDGAEIASLPGDATSYIDQGLAEGDHSYQVQVTLGGVTGGPNCTATVYIVAPGTKVSVDLGRIDDEDGLANVVREDPSDGENESTTCGPAGDRREGRSNFAAVDPTPDAPDTMFYFTLTDLAMKSQPKFALKATVYDDPARAGAPIALQYTVAASTGPDDLPNTFFPFEKPPPKAFAGSGKWVPLEWEITDACFRNFQKGAADFRLMVTDGGRVCIDKVELVFVAEPPPLKFNFHRGDADQNAAVELTDAVQILTYLFLGTPTNVPECLDAADADDNGDVQLTDAVWILGFLFLGTDPPPAPGPHTAPCGPDPTEDGLINSECRYEGC